MIAGASVAVVVVTYFPDEPGFDRLTQLREEVARLVIVDNGSGPAIQARLQKSAVEMGATLVCNPDNRGLAAALNQGLELAADAGCEWVVTLDQDSTPRPAMVSELLSSVRTAPEPDRVAVVGARTIDERLKNEGERWLLARRWGFKLVPCEREDLHGVTFVITSGALTRVSAWRHLGRFDETLFIDYIDHDFCLKARRAGWDILVSARAGLLHNLGAKRVVEVAGRPMRPTFHSATRHYYMARNRILMWRRYAWRFPHWWLFDACYGGLNLIRVLVAEDQRGAKLTAALRGSWHGLLGRSGPMPP